MNKEKWFALEYGKSRNELNNRIVFLHKTINLAIILWVVFLIITFIIIGLGVKRDLLHTFLLFIPIIMDLLAFNYQSNQNSLESIPRYYYYYLKPILEQKYGNDTLHWEEYFAKEKEPFKYESVTKVFPFVLPSLIPFYFLFTRIPLKSYQFVLVAIDILFLLLMIYIFRYKLRRVK
ncbi:MAG: hypothetical protein WCV58_04410 [Patescibacteria group bacterium]